MAHVVSFYKLSGTTGTQPRIRPLHWADGAARSTMRFGYQLQKDDSPLAQEQHLP